MFLRFYTLLDFRLRMGNTPEMPKWDISHLDASELIAPMGHTPPFARVDRFIALSSL